ncbi:MAG: hypothetical protein ACKO6Q_04750 [Bacteroidota bacterium]
MKHLLFIGLLGLATPHSLSAFSPSTQGYGEMLAPAASKGKPNAFEYKTYYNRSRMFKIDYPSFLTMGQGSQNGDGREFYGSGGIVLSVSSSYYTDLSISDRYYNEFADKSQYIEYKVLRPNWYVVSGTSRQTGKEFYKKVYYSNTYGDQIRTMSLEYPKSRMDDFDVIIPRLIQSFKDM